MHDSPTRVSYGPRFATIEVMRKLLIVFALGCGGGAGNLSGTESAPRPSPAEGGFQAQPAPVVREWVALGVPAPVTPAQQTLELGGHPGAVSSLLVKGVSGEPEIQHIRIEYMDKSIRGVDVGKRFVPGDGQVIELKEHRPIQKIIVFLDPDSQGSVEILGG